MSFFDLHYTIKRAKNVLTITKALAAVGQGRLMSMYDQLFSHFHQPIAQVLLTRHDIADVRSMCAF
jgi:glutamate 5-kinase